MGLHVSQSVQQGLSGNFTFIERYVVSVPDLAFQ